MVLLRSIATIGGLTLVSRILGFVRDILIAAVIGAGASADAFFVAFKLPNLFRRLFAEGAFNAGFVPLFTDLLEREGKEAARAFSEQALSVLLWTLLVVVVAMQMSMPLVMLGFAPGFAATPERFDLAVQLTRITFPYLVFISLVSLMAGLLNSLGRFAAAAATPILLNLGLIGAMLALAPLTPTPAHALAWGVAGSGMAQFLWLLWRCDRAGVRLRLPRPRLTTHVRLLIRRILPLAIGVGVYQINLLIDTVVASLLPAGSISYLYFADRVTQLPLGVVGVAVGTALLPLLSRQLRAGEAEAAAHNQNRALEFSCLLSLPAAVALIVIAEPAIAVLFERGAFGPAEVRAASAALAVYAVGIPAYVMVKALAPGYFARGDTATPVKISVACLVVNLVLNLVLMGPFKHVGIAMATAVSAWLNAGLLAAILGRRGFLAIDGRLGRRLPRIAAASAGMALVLVLVQWTLQGALAADQVLRVTALAGLVAAGLASFAALAIVLGAAQVADLKHLFRGPRA